MPRLSLRENAIPASSWMRAFWRVARVLCQPRLGDRARTVIRVKAIYHRNNPILTCSQPGVPPHTFTLMLAVADSVAIADVWRPSASRDTIGVGPLYRERRTVQRHLHQTNVLRACQTGRVDRFTVFCGDGVLYGCGGRGH